MPKKKKKKIIPLSKVFSIEMAMDCIKLLGDGKQRLNLSFKEFDAVPESIQKLWRVEELILGRNLIVELPDFLRDFTKIQVLDLHSNYLEKIPPTIGLLKSLVVLNLCNNRLKQVPKELGLLQNLEKLYLGLNKLQILPKAMGELHELVYIGLSDNRFSVVPTCLANLPKLEKINLDRNPFPPPPDLKKMALPKTFFMVNAYNLCEVCLKNCRADRKKLLNAGQVKATEDVPRVETVT
ncbi:leucine-rich repeat-containing protein 18 [Syngnathus acus]|uniref:leucine-rich repeat-containing protein 18 n=1 Tax=Syngnathus acus TaxID=161584 RepID=UPI001885FB09|nr:leucine-rich repeat-containing protein 18 [Syngnathus acus]